MTLPDGTSEISENSDGPELTFTDTGSSDATSYDFSNWQEEDTSQPDPQKNNNTQESFYSNVFTDDIPQVFRDKMLPGLQEIDKGVQRKFQEIHDSYSAYKTFQDQQVSADDLNAALNFANTFRSDPVSFLTQVQQALAEQGLLQQQEQGEDNGEELLTPTELEMRRMQENLEAQNQVFNNYIQEQQQAQQRAEYEAATKEVYNELLGQLNTLETDIGRPLPPQLKAEVFQRLQIMEQRTGKQVSVREAFTDLMNLGQTISGSKKAPRVMSAQPNAGTNVQQQTFDTADQRQSAVEDFLRRANNQ